jgi:hypothetical protein
MKKAVKPPKQTRRVLNADFKLEPARRAQGASLKQVGREFDVGGEPTAVAIEESDAPAFDVFQSCCRLYDGSPGRSHPGDGCLGESHLQRCCVDCWSLPRLFRIFRSILSCATSRRNRVSSA